MASTRTARKVIATRRDGQLERVSGGALASFGVSGTGGGTGTPVNLSLYISKSEGNNGYLDTRYYTETESDTLFYTQTYLDTLLNQPVKTTSSPTFVEAFIPVIKNDTQIGSSLFVSGFSGSGYEISKDVSNLYTATLDALSVRGTFSVYELLIQKIRASNGSIWVSDTMQINKVTDGGGTTLFFEWDTKGGDVPNTFVANDIIKLQTWTGSGIISSQCRVSSAGSSFITVLKVDVVGSTPVAGDWVRIGNTTNTDRQGNIYLTSSDIGSPFIDVLAGVDSNVAAPFFEKTKCRLGKLDGITDIDAGLDGTATNLYGLYSQDVYLKGHIFSQSGEIGGWDINTNTLVSGNITLNSDTDHIQITKDSNNYVRMYYTSTSDWGLHGKGAGSDIFRLGSTNKIGAINFDDSYMWTGTKVTDDVFAAYGITWYSGGGFRTPTLWMNADGGMGMQTNNGTGKRIEFNWEDNRFNLYNSNGIECLRLDENEFSGLIKSNRVVSNSVIATASLLGNELVIADTSLTTNEISLYVSPSGITYLKLENLPTTGQSLSSGNVYSNNGVLTIVP